MDRINAVLLSPPMLQSLPGIDLLFTIWSKAGQVHSLTDGVALRQPWHRHLRGEQAMIYLVGPAGVRPYRWLWGLAAAGACFGFIQTSVEPDTLSTIGVGFMYAINLPPMRMQGSRAKHADRDHFARLRLGVLRRR